MILYLDIRREEVRLAVIEAAAKKTGAKWLRIKGDNVVAKALAAAKQKLGLSRRKPKVIAVAMSAADSTMEKRNVSWSGVRQGVAVANALAFAWGVPVVKVLVRGDEVDEEVVVLAKKAAKGAKKGEWVRAVYSGEPTITKAKKVL